MKGFLSTGVPPVNVVTALGDWWYHSEHDTLDKCDPDTMHMAEKAQTLVLLRLCTLPVLPYRIEALAEWMLDTLGGLEGRAEGMLSLEGITEKAALFKERAAELDEATSRLSARCGDDIKGHDVEIKAANGCMMRISRTLNPVNYTLRGRYDQDYYGAEYVRPIPILQPMSELATLNPDSTEFKALKTKLVRARNAVSDAIEDATWISELTIDEIAKI